MLSEITAITNRGRSTSFKKTVDTSDGRRVREQTTLHIRKQKKDEQLRKKRFKSDVQMMDENNNVPSSTLMMHDSKNPTAKDIPQLANIVMGDNPQEEKFDAMVSLRRLLSKERNPPVDIFLATGALPHIIRGLTIGFNDHSLALESERILGYISHRHTAEVLGAGGAAPLVQLLNSDCISVREEAIWCLGNIAGENAEARDTVLAQNPIPFLVKNLKNPSSVSLLENCFWCISNLVRGEKAPKHDVTKPLVYPMAGSMDYLLSNAPKCDNALNELLWAFTYLSNEGGAEFEDHLATINHIMGTGITSKIVQLIKSDRPTILKSPLIRIMKNFVAGSDNQTESVLDAGFLDCVPILLSSKSPSIQWDTYFALSNIAAGHSKQAGQLLKRKDIMEHIIDSAIRDEWKIRKEAIWVLIKMVEGEDEGKSSLIVPLVELHGLSPLAQCLEKTASGDLDLIIDALKAIDTILAFGQANTELGYGYILQEYGGVSHLENLQNHQNEEIYQLCVKILQTYFDAEEEEGGEGIVPSTNMDTGTYNFDILTPVRLFEDNNRPFASSFGL